MFPPVGSGERADFRVRPTTELHATNDRRFFGRGAHPVNNHLNIGHIQFNRDAGQFATANLEEVRAELQSRRIRSLRRAGSAFAEMPLHWSDSVETLPLNDTRLVFRDVVHASNQRKVWCALVPPEVILTNSAPYLLFSAGGTREQAYLLGLLGSSVVDWYAHRRIVLHLNYFIFNAIPLPEGIPSDPRVDRVAGLAAALAMTSSDEIDNPDWLRIRAPIDSEADALSELDALASLLFEVESEDLSLIWDGVNPLRPALRDVRRFREKWTNT
jgi:hypothetical protein